MAQKKSKERPEEPLGTIGPIIRGKIRRVLHKTRLKYNANFPYKQHISSKIRRGLAKTRLIRLI